MNAIGPGRVHTICIGYQQTTKVAASKCLNETNTSIIGLSKTIAITTCMFRFLFFYLFIYFVFFGQTDRRTDRKTDDRRTNRSMEGQMYGQTVKQTDREKKTILSFLNLPN